MIQYHWANGTGWFQFVADEFDVTVGIGRGTHVTVYHSMSIEWDEDKEIIVDYDAPDWQ